MSTLRLLALLVIVQAALAVFSWWPSDRSALRPHPLLEIGADAISGISIARKPAEGAEPEWLRLVRDGSGWRIESEAGYPADASKVEQLLDKLVGMQVRAPIASQTTSHNALEVGDKEYGRRIRIQAGELERELIIGAAQSNSVNVRFVDENDVHLASGVSEWSLRDDARSYWSTEYVQVAPSEIAELRVENAAGVLLLRREGEGWSLDGLPEGAAVNSAAIEAFVTAVTSLRMSEPVGETILPEHGLDSGIRLGWTIAADNASVGSGYAIGTEEGGQIFVKADSSSFVVKVAASALSQLKQAKRSDFYTLPLEADRAEGDTHAAPAAN